MGLIDIYVTFPLKVTKYTFFSSAKWNILKNKPYVGLKTGLNKFKTFESYQPYFLTMIL